MSKVKITVEEARKICELKNLAPAKVLNQDVVQFTSGDNPRRSLRLISWEDFARHLEAHGLAVYTYKGFMKILKEE